MAKVLIFSRYAMLTNDEPREDGKYYSRGMVTYAWYIFEKGFEGDTILKHILIIYPIT